MIKKASFLSVLCLVIFTGSIFAHGINVETSFHGRVLVVKSSFSPTQAMVNASVTIYSPADPENAWQRGITDKAGQFAFVPDLEGEWIFVIDDEKGHMKRVTIGVTAAILEGEQAEDKEEDEEEAVTIAEPSERGLNTVYKIILGLSIIFGISGIFYGLKARQGPKTE